MQKQTKNLGGCFCKVCRSLMITSYWNKGENASEILVPLANLFSGFKTIDVCAKLYNLVFFKVFFLLRYFFHSDNTSFAIFLQKLRTFCNVRSFFAKITLNWKSLQYLDFLEDFCICIDLKNFARFLQNLFV